ncbi:MAG: hypothetical protein IPO21_20720 [Bacteroidales bacterium]|nr:hypothetical protein [Bacteroidales bacterium]
MKKKDIEQNKNILETHYKKTFEKLQLELEKKKELLREYLTETKKQANNLSKDNKMIDFFKIKNEYYYLKKDTVLPENIVKSVEQLKREIQSYYIMNYIQFYDILFIDTLGEIFYTLKKQADYQKNIFSSDLDKYKISEKLKSRPFESFVDYQFYDISGETSAFFIEPVIDKEKQIGWFVLQLTSNSINSILTSDDNMDKTEETILVNKEHYMLTNSRFSIDNTILTKKLSKENIESKFKEGKGEKIVIDYRDKEVLSVFEVIKFFDSEWLLISKIDKNEVLSGFYAENKNYLFNILENELSKNKTISLTHIKNKDSVISVNMDEYKRIDTTEIIFTQGVSTCTAIAIVLPGKFAYLAHISPFDAIYKDKKTDIIKDLLKKISYFEITESQKELLEFKIMSTKTYSLELLIDKLITNGYNLNQIKILINNKSDFGNIYSNLKTNQTYVNWRTINNHTDISSQDFKDAENLETILMNNCMN